MNKRNKIEELDECEMTSTLALSGSNLVETNCSLHKHCLERKY